MMSEDGCLTATVGQRCILCSKKSDDCEYWASPGEQQQTV